MKHDHDGQWRPYESWVDGGCNEGEWIPHSCESDGSLGSRQWTPDVSPPPPANGLFSSFMNPFRVPIQEP